ncbi:hypothetical protein [Arthrobacter sp. QXT-31]|uniref:hypothetical protein n=1 Tax=Arthrobacter sp. QXT-31 TaxID=1357915 RepID=UPI0012FC30D1|nr:hypothetical protein [Arthrobacter sp. QXT-31]
MKDLNGGVGRSDRGRGGLEDGPAFGHEHVGEELLVESDDAGCDSFELGLDQQDN